LRCRPIVLYPIKTTIAVQPNFPLLVGAVMKLNQMMHGWANYFCLGPVSKAYQAVERHGRKRLRQWLCAKHKVSWPATGKFPEASLHDKFGLVRLTERTRSFSWAKS
jgi:hypothetical protein